MDWNAWKAAWKGRGKRRRIEAAVDGGFCLLAMIALIVFMGWTAKRILTGRLETAAADPAAAGALAPAAETETWQSMETPEETEPWLSAETPEETKALTVTTAIPMARSAPPTPPPEAADGAAPADETPPPADPEEWGAAAEVMARCCLGEAGNCDQTQQAAVYWNILNRVDAQGFQDNIISVVTAENQYAGYVAGNVVLPELYDLALDVIGRWQAEKAGLDDVGRVLPADYLWFNGNGRINFFRNQEFGGDVWDWSLPSPYEQ